VKWFVQSAGAVLAVTGVGKVWSGLGDSKFLAVVDPIIGIRFGHLMLAVGVAEIVFALVCFFNKRQTLALGLVAWLSTNFVIYRLGLWWMDWHRPCSCLGNLTDALHISPQTADNIMKVVLAYLLIGSYGLIFWQWRQGRAKANTQVVEAI
jgi:Methylamine utilisation protein MauE